MPSSQKHSAKHGPSNRKNGPSRKGSAATADADQRNEETPRHPASSAAASHDGEPHTEATFTAAAKQQLDAAATTAKQQAEQAAASAKAAALRATTAVEDAARRAQETASEKLHEAQRYVGENIEAAGKTLERAGKKLQS